MKLANFPMISLKPKKKYTNALLEVNAMIHLFKRPQRLINKDRFYFA